MVSIKELLDDLGGGRSVTLGAVLVVCVYVAADRYVGTVEARLADIETRTRALEAAKARFDAYEPSSSERISRLERRVDSRGNH